MNPKKLTLLLSLTLTLTLPLTAIPFAGHPLHYFRRYRFESKIASVNQTLKIPVLPFQLSTPFPYRSFPFTGIQRTGLSAPLFLSNGGRARWSFFKSDTHRFNPSFPGLSMGPGFNLEENSTIEPYKWGNSFHRDTLYIAGH